MTWFEIRPQDVWLFRDGKPFSAGEDHSAHSMFPPTPLTVQGALRQKISVSLGVSLSQYQHQSTDDARRAAEYIGAFEQQKIALNTGMFRMVGPFVSLNTDRGFQLLFPAPADLLKREHTHEFMISAPDIWCNSDFPLVDMRFPRVVQDYENLPGHWVTGSVLADYLDGYVPDASVFQPRPPQNMDRPHDAAGYPDAATTFDHAGKHIWHQDCLVVHESRVGVDVNATTGASEKGLLYQVDFVRPLKGVGLAVSVTGIPEDVEDLLTGQIALGGERRRADVRSLDPVYYPPLPEQVTGQFKVVFLTPAYFSGGWQPEGGDWSRVFGLPSNTVRLVSAALYRPLQIGGWNSATLGPRTMHNYVTPGSVYYFETDAVFSPPPALTESPTEIEDTAGIGFGQYVLGTWS